ncbi:MAG: hypothetical protein F3739_08270 [Nitrospinae bacterium]|nr:hypothetical protein [Nitrospinota bacterium]
MPAFGESLKVKKEGVDPKFDSEHKEKIFSLLALEGRHIDNLIENSDLSPAQVSATLLQLELRGLVRQLSEKMYITNYGDE